MFSLISIPNTHPKILLLEWAPTPAGREGVSPPGSSQAARPSRGAAAAAALAGGAIAEGVPAPRCVPCPAPGFNN